MKHFLFICGKNKFRSPTAEALFSHHRDIDARSAGVNYDSDHIVNFEDIEWADHIFCMEEGHKKKLLDKYKKLIKDQKVTVLNIPDRYGFMDEELLQIIKNKLMKYV